MTAIGQPGGGGPDGGLTAIEVRVLGCLVEKESTTPGSYPLTRNALRNACNQTTSRDPVVDFTDQQVEAALLSLRDRRLARAVRNPGDRVTKFRHAMPEAWDLDRAQTAILTLLLLRGAQTAGELRSRTGRLYPFDDVDAVDRVLSSLVARQPTMVAEVARRPGQKERRWRQLVGASHDVGGAADVDRATRPAAGDAGPDAGPGGPTGTHEPVVRAWLVGARAVLEALASPQVAAAWERPSVLAEQTVGGLAGHLARGSVWVVGDYLDRDTPVGVPDFASPAAYFVELLDALTDDDHDAVRRRGAAVAALGHDHVLATLRSRLATLEETVVEVDPDRLVAVFGGLSIRLSDYLVTRIVEQVVHLDDLARSVDGLEIEPPRQCLARAEQVGLDVLRHRHGPSGAIRTLFRHDFRDRVPVL